ncbi:hypothetical protein, partial [Kytococcus schroeteri]|uniref:hypothetical protein n=1 Tax=Kytococcus schroeteri TaxID=138300 RepID=UPI00192D0D4E
MSENTPLPADLLSSPSFQLERLRRRTRDFVETALAEKGTLIDIVRATASACPEAPAIDDGKGVITYSELLDEI